MSRQDRRDPEHQERRRGGRRLSDHYATIPQAARHTNVSTKTVRKWIECRILTAYRLPSGVSDPAARSIMRIKWDDLETFLKRHKLSVDACEDPGMPDMTAANQKPPRSS